MSTVAFLSFRLGMDDGVSIVARTWREAFSDLGWETYDVAGEGSVEQLVPGLEIGAEHAPDTNLLESALAKADLVVVENLLTIPINLGASRVAASVLAGRPALLHHHDPPWQRGRYKHVTELPADDPCWRHATINKLTARQFAERGLSATTIYNGFDHRVGVGDRHRTRRDLGVADDELLFLHPVRAIGRKNISTAVGIAEAAGASYWLTGPSEEGYGDELETILASTDCRVIRRPFDNEDDAYAAADLILFPSIWEGFGIPPIEAALRMKPVVIGSYPVAEELAGLGFSWLEASMTPAGIERIVNEARQPQRSTLESNRRIATENLSLEKMAESVKTLLDGAGWTP